MVMFNSYGTVYQSVKFEHLWSICEVDQKMRRPPPNPVGSNMMFNMKLVSCGDSPFSDTPNTYNIICIDVMT